MEKTSNSKNKKRTKKEIGELLRKRPEEFKKNQSVNLQPKNEPGTVYEFRFNGSQKISVYVEDKIFFEKWAGFLNPVLHQMIFRKLLENKARKFGIETPVVVGFSNNFALIGYTIEASGETLGEIAGNLTKFRNEINEKIELQLLDVKAAVRKRFRISNQYVSSKKL